MYFEFVTQIVNTDTITVVPANTGKVIFLVWHLFALIVNDLISVFEAVCPVFVDFVDGDDAQIWVVVFWIPTAATSIRR